MFLPGSCRASRPTSAHMGQNFGNRGRLLPASLSGCSLLSRNLRYMISGLPARASFALYYIRFPGPFQSQRWPLFPEGDIVIIFTVGTPHFSQGSRGKVPQQRTAMAAMHRFKYRGIVTRVISVFVIVHGLVPPVHAVRIFAGISFLKSGGGIADRQNS